MADEYNQSFDFSQFFRANEFQHEFDGNLTDPPLGEFEKDIDNVFGASTEEYLPSSPNTNENHSFVQPSLPLQVVHHQGPLSTFTASDFSSSGYGSIYSVDPIFSDYNPNFDYATSLSPTSDCLLFSQEINNGEIGSFGVDPADLSGTLLDPTCNTLGSSPSLLIHGDTHSDYNTNSPVLPPISYIPDGNSTEATVTTSPANITIQFSMGSTEPPLESGKKINICHFCHQC